MSMPAPRSAAGAEALAALAQDAAHAIVALDFDGTIAPIVDRPDAARPHPAARSVLARLAPYVGRLAVITGRPAEFVVDEGGLAGVESLVVLGHYGLERWEGGQVSAPDAEPGVQAARRELPQVLSASAAPAGTYVEDKGRSLAVHVRGTSDPANALRQLAEPVSALALATGLVVEQGRMVLELRPASTDKGEALRSLAETMAAGGPVSAVVFVGDDLGDMAAFDEVERLRAQGVPGLLICSASTEVTALAARADLVVDGPDGVLAWLVALVEHLANE
jgi:trehalose 6-phosphate phosphatase